MKRELKEHYKGFYFNASRDTEPFPMKRELKEHYKGFYFNASRDTEPFPMKRELKEFKLIAGRFMPSAIQNHSL